LRKEKVSIGSSPGGSSIVYKPIFRLSRELKFSYEQRSADGIHFLGFNYGGYRDECLKLFGQEYYKLDTQIYGQWNPFRLPGVKNN